MKKTLFYPILAALLLAVQPALCAADGAVNVTFTTLGLTDVNGVGYLQGSSVSNLAAQANAIGDIYHYTGPATMSLVVKSGQTSTPVGQVTFPGATGKFILVIGKESNGRVTASAVPDNVTEFPVMSARVINATPLLLGVEINSGQAVGIKASDYKVIPIAKDMQRVAVNVVIPKAGGGTQDVANNMYSIDPTARVTVVLALTNAAAIQANPKTPPSIRTMGFVDGGNHNAPSASARTTPNASANAGANQARGTQGTANQTRNRTNN